MDHKPIVKSVCRLDDVDKQLIRSLISGQRITVAFAAFLSCCCCAVFIISLVGYILAPGMAMFFLLFFGAGAGVLTFFLARTMWQKWNRKIKPLQYALRHGGQKAVLEGDLKQATVSGKDLVSYQLGGADVSVYLILSTAGLALFPQRVYSVTALAGSLASLHVLLLPDKRQLLLKAVYKEEGPVLDPRFRATISGKSVKASLAYIVLTCAYVGLLFLILFGILPIGILLGVLPVTLLYFFAMRWVGRRSKQRKQVTRVVGRVTEIISVPARTEVMGQPSSSHRDTWFRIDGRAYCMTTDDPLTDISLGDSIELTLIGNNGAQNRFKRGDTSGRRVL